MFKFRSNSGQKYSPEPEPEQKCSSGTGTGIPVDLWIQFRHPHFAGYMPPSDASYTNFLKFSDKKYDLKYNLNQL